MSAIRFQPGQLLLRRYFRLGEVISVIKYGRVVSDDEQGLLVWFAPGAPLRWRVAADGREMRGMPFAEWITLSTRLEERTWYGSGTLLLMPP